MLLVQEPELDFPTSGHAAPAPQHWLKSKNIKVPLCCSLFAALVDWSWMSYNIYCYYVVRSHFTNVKWYQSPDIEVLDDMAG